MGLGSGETVGSIEYDARLNTAQFKKDAAEINRTAHETGSNVSKSWDNTVGASRSAATGVLALGAALGVAGGFAIKSAEEFQQNRIAFETMLGSADKARGLLAKVSDFAAKTPFELPQVVTGAKQLLAYGIAADNILPTFSALGNIAAGVGRDKLPQLILAFGQVRAATKLTGAELRQFTEAGVPLLEELAKQSGKSAAQIKEDMDGGLAPSFEEVQKALFAMSGEGGKFFNLMEKQSKTFGGTMSNLSDQFGRLARRIVGIDEMGDVKEGSIFARLSIAAAGFLKWLEKNAGAIEKNFIKAFDWLESNGKSIAAMISGAMVPAFIALAGSIGVTMLRLSPFIAAGYVLQKAYEHSPDLFWALAAALTAVGVAGQAMTYKMLAGGAGMKMLGARAATATPLLRGAGLAAGAVAVGLGPWGLALAAVALGLGYVAIKSGALNKVLKQTDRDQTTAAGSATLLSLAQERVVRNTNAQKAAHDHLKAAQHGNITAQQALKKANDDLTLAQQGVTNALNTYGQNSPQYLAAQELLNAKTREYNGALYGAADGALTVQGANYGLKTANEALMASVSSLFGLNKMLASSLGDIRNTIGTIGPVAALQVAPIANLGRNIVEVIARFRGLQGEIQGGVPALNAQLQGVGSTIDRVQNAAKDLQRTISSTRLQGAASGTNLQGATGTAPVPQPYQARASGGPVSSGNLYMVGEDGPEWFTTRKNGFILPNMDDTPSGKVINNIGTINISSDVDGERLLKRLGRDDEITAAGVVSG